MTILNDFIQNVKEMAVEFEQLNYDDSDTEEEKSL